MRRAVLWAGLMLTTGLASAAEASEGPPQVRVGEAAPGFRLPDLDGDVVDLEDFRGQYLVIHFGASW